MIVILDNGHGNNTPGKRSPDGVLREYAYTREIARLIKEKLESEHGIEIILLVPEEEDISLGERCRRANQIYTKQAKCDAILISIHLNACTDGSCWGKGVGFEAYTYYGVSKSDILAECLYEAAEKYLPGKIMRTDLSDGDKDKESGFYILKHTIMPAVLTENLFMDNKKEYEFLLSPEGKEAIVNLHVQGILDYISKIKEQ